MPSGRIPNWKIRGQLARVVSRAKVSVRIALDQLPVAHAKCKHSAHRVMHSRLADRPVVRLAVQDTQNVDAILGRAVR